ncbi:thioredoxin-dependent thiol peroxidase [Pseudomaricurvus alkylphenolicus]|jgi:peroxiredoxin Q/BCP|uniref:thioredoxin-dependent thiol peroxidase n=1 Tax=Pseudomaricurvus alkylphenolicus TaxID=1306991 RepID=UPI001420CA8A|nr:thioredoxin-dependent thiol peroxidase [Pseudomaricurvus alkylphenolicus]NIB41210.1 thioredoxin-dependent thiol peroxidase [Pseudomaricurvus alkylphenolicus]
MAYPKIGNMAPAFTLQKQDGTKVSLKDFRGTSNVVLYFYPKAMTPGCTTQACGLRDTKAELDDLDTVVLGVSPDAYPRLQKFIDKQELNFDLLSDEDHAIAEKYGVWGLKKFMGKEFMGILRTTFIIGKDGRLKAVMDKFKTKSHHDDVLEQLGELDL